MPCWSACTPAKWSTRSRASSGRRQRPLIEEALRPSCSASFASAHHPLSKASRMPKFARTLILSCSMLASAPVAAQAQPALHQRLFQLFKDSDEAQLRRNPLQALFRGDLRYADRLGDLFSDAHYQGERAAAQHDLAALHAIPRAQLAPSDQLAYDVFEFQTKDTLRGLQPGLLRLEEA